MTPEQAASVDAVHLAELRAYKALATALLSEVRNNPTYYLPPKVEALLFKAINFTTKE